MNALKIAGLTALCFALSACGGGNGDKPEVPPPATPEEMAEDGDEPEEPSPPTPEEVAREDFARIAGEANAILTGDLFGYEEGEAMPERVEYCGADNCSVGLVRVGWSSVENRELEILSGPNDIRMVVERGSDDYALIHALGGWMEHSLFVSQATLYPENIAPESTSVTSYAFGNASGANPDVPESGASWRGFVVGRDDSVRNDREAVVEGQASVFVEMGADSLLADVAFTDLSNGQTQQNYDDMAWEDLTVSEGGFAHRDAVDHMIAGRFFGPEQQEVAGVFERAGINGAFGGRQH